MKVKFSRPLVRYILLNIAFVNLALTDSFENNSYNNNGSVGLINTPSARFYDEGVHGVTFYDGTPDQKITLTSSPYDWLEASFFYTNIQGLPYPGYAYQDYKDKGFNIKLRFKKEGTLPALAIGLSDFAGTGFYSSEYIVSSYGINNLDFHFGLGWGQLNGSSKQITNPLTYISSSFDNRPLGNKGGGGQFDPDKYFSSETVSPFYGISYSLNNKILLKIERDVIKTSGTGDSQLVYDARESNYSFGFDYSINSNFTIGASFERGNYASVKFVYKNNPKKTFKKYEYQEAEVEDRDSKYEKLIKNLENNGIGVNKISETAQYVGLDLTQFIHKDIKAIEEIISEASADAGIDKSIKKDLKIATLDAYSEIDEMFGSTLKNEDDE